MPMVERDDVVRTEILRTNHALRQWAGSLRVRGERARAACRGRRLSAAPWERPAGDATPVGRAEADESTNPEPRLPSMGTVPVTELFAILVDQHGMAVVDAVRALIEAMVVAGYPSDHPWVSAADAFDIIDRAVRRS